MICGIKTGNKTVYPVTVSCVFDDRFCGADTDETLVMPIN